MNGAFSDNLTPIWRLRHFDENAPAWGRPAPTAPRIDWGRCRGVFGSAEAGGLAAEGPGRRGSPCWSSPAWCASGLLQDEHVAVRVADDGLRGPWLVLRGAVELDAGSVQPLVFGVEVIAGQHEPAQ
jgi:hypothetical protein